MTENQVEELEDTNIQETIVELNEKTIDTDSNLDKKESSPKKQGKKVKGKITPKETKKETVDKKDSNNISGGSVHALIDGIESVEFEINATGQKSTQKSEVNFIRLLRGRIYYIPVKENHINSDNFETLKVYSSISNKIDVRFVKDGIACIVPYQHGVILKNNQHICTIF